MKNNDLEKIKELYKKGKYRKCIFLCEKELKLDHENFDILGYQVLALSKNDIDPKKTIELCNKLIHMRIEVDFYYFRGNAYYKIGKYTLAIKDFEKSIKIDPSNSPTWDLLARSYYRAGNIKKAFKNIDMAIKISKSKNFDALAVKVLMLRDEGKVDNAFELFLDIRKKFPSNELLSNEICPIFSLLSDDFFKKQVNK